MKARARQASITMGAITALALSAVLGIMPGHASVTGVGEGITHGGPVVAYVVNAKAGTVTLISIWSGQPGKPV
jgi:hypothetical protein